MWGGRLQRVEAMLRLIDSVEAYEKAILCLFAI